jgi:hypothetical protein
VATRADTTLKPAGSLTPEQARDARARAWAFVFDCFYKKKATCPGGPDDAEDLRNDRTATENYTG